MRHLQAFDRLAERLRLDRGPGGVGVGEDDDELLPAESGQEIAGARSALGEGGRHALETAVAGQMAEAYGRVGRAVRRELNSSFHWA